MRQHRTTLSRRSSPWTSERPVLVWVPGVSWVGTHILDHTLLRRHKRSILHLMLSEINRGLIIASRTLLCVSHAL